MYTVLSLYIHCRLVQVQGQSGSRSKASPGPGPRPVRVQVLYVGMCDLGTICRTRHFFGCRLVARLIGIAVLQLADIFRGRIYEYFAGFAVPHDVYTQQSQDETQEEQWQGNVFGDTKHAITYRKI